MVKTNAGIWQTFQPSQAPLGAFVHEKIIELETAFKGLCRQLKGVTLLFSVTQQDPDIFKKPSQSVRLNCLDYIETARVTVTDTFDNYWSKRGKNLRQNLRRQRNRLEREQTNIALNILQNPQDVYNAIKQYGELEAAGWKNSQGTAVSINNAQGEFYTQLLTDYCETGNGVIYQYQYNNKLVATDLCISRNGTIIILKTTFDESIKTSSPAMLMRQDVFQKIFEDKLYNNIEFYGKVMDWHTKWTKEIRRMYHINFYNSLLIKFLKKLK